MIKGEDAVFNSEESKMARFGPVYEKGEIEANRKAKELAWNHIFGQSGGDEAKGSIAAIEVEAMGSYDPTVVEKLKPGSFLQTMVRDGCFFLQIALHILGGGDHLKYPEQNPYLEKKNVIKDKGRWPCPPTDELEKLALYLTVVEPELERPKWMRIFRRKPPQFRDGEPPSNILEALHSLVLGSGHNDPIHSEMKEYGDLEAGGEESDIKIPSAGELKRSSISLRMGCRSGITNIRFQSLGFYAFLLLPPLTINASTQRVFTVLASYERNLNESDREVTSYLHFMRDLAHTYKDFKILERKGIIIVKDKELKCTMINNIIKSHSHKSSLTLNFRHTRRRLKNYGGPPWRLISFFLGFLTLVQTIFTVLSYFSRK